MTLPDSIKQQDKILLLRESGLDSNNIAGILGIKSSTVRGVLSRAKEIKLQDSVPEDSQASSAKATTTADASGAK